MKRIINVIKNKIDWVMIVIGTFLVCYGLLDFRCSAQVKFETIQSWGYYYVPDAQFKVAVGAGLIVLGILIYKNKKYQ